MYPDFLVDDELSGESSVKMQEVLNYFADLEQINKEIDILLEDENWEGDSKSKCVGAIQMMEDYRGDLEDIAESIKKYVEKIVSDANDFVNQSDKVESIRKV